MIDLDRFVGRGGDSLTFGERQELAGKWVAIEIYSPVTLPLRVFRAVGDSAAECRRQLRDRGLDVTHFEYFVMPSM